MKLKTLLIILGAAATLTACFSPDYQRGKVAAHLEAQGYTVTAVHSVEMRSDNNAYCAKSPWYYPFATTNGTGVACIDSETTRVTINNYNQPALTLTPGDAPDPSPTV